MKGQQQALSAILITGVLISVVGSVYFWGLPLIQKNKDVSLLESGEIFMINLNNKIKDIANHGGRDRIELTVPGVLEFNGENITLEIETSGSIYADSARISLSRNSCSLTSGTWGVHKIEVLCLMSQCLGSSGDVCHGYLTEYKLNYIPLRAGAKTYRIVLSGEKAYGGYQDYIQIENKGTVEEGPTGNLINTRVEISIL